MSKWVDYIKNGLHNVPTQSLRAMQKRNLIAQTENGDYRLTRNAKVYVYAMELLESYEFVVLRKKDAKMGMMCYREGNDIVDCWGKIYDLENVVNGKGLGRK